MAAALAVVLSVKRDEGSLLRISYDGKILETLDLEGDMLEEGVYYLFLYENNSVSLEKSEVYPDVPEGVNFNLLYVSTGDIQMKAADCRDQICVEHKPIEAGGESIICLPHKLVVEIVGMGNEETLDGMVR